ncbi:T9SS type A sorting domain-containing protein [Lacinutrix sp. C3R15]|uniref:T9SS type A sorting domain-containing protein n=1 Tax=Flavobacteriaceae TaxID=49546 RepID=UPI001C081134|nr:MULTISPECIES: T9SS type A sorting domain-containing protein [Flavobacteriaceae]MBU2939638.1 T9SS type A sorting domain-containing protein [Lacinutrix sp. C3R15]MDO6622953.1 T9SS type A sorting domain-containing protein [Oceanihabitans sp. 1_MG-2023]
MTKSYITFLFFLAAIFNLNAQITLHGCETVLSNQDFVLNNTGTIDDGATIRNTFESTPSDFSQSCSAGVCELRIIWNTSAFRWEIQLDNDGPLGTPDYDTAVLYYNTTASTPNPPDLTLGTWVDANSFCGGNGSLTLTGDVQSSTLSINTFDLQSKIKLYPNPSINYLQVSGLTKTEYYRLFNVLGAEVNNGRVSNNGKIDTSNLTNGLYFLKFENGNTFKFIKE